MLPITRSQWAFKGVTPDRLVIIQIFTRAGRTIEVEQRAFRTVAEQLERLGIGGEDVFTSIVENGPHDWSFGFGRAQYTECVLPVLGRRRCWVHLRPTGRLQLGRNRSDDS